MGGEDGDVLDLGFAGHGGRGQLQVPDELVALDGDQDAAGVEIGVELRRGVLGELEQRSQLRPGALVLLDADRCGAHATHAHESTTRTATHWTAFTPYPPWFQASALSSG